MHKFKLAVLGGGNMATAIINGIIKGGVLAPDQIIVSDPSEERKAYFLSINVAVAEDNSELVTSAKYLLLAVKPQVAVQILGELKSVITATHIISIMAGFKIEKIKALLGDVKVARIMPNLPVTVGEGMSAIDCTDFDDGEQSFVVDVFNSLGKVVLLPESTFDAVTSVSGSGPAYVYAFIDAMIKGGVDGGLSEEQSKALTLQTLVGAIKMVENSDLPISTLIDNVCSKGGTTIEAVKCFRENGLESTVREGIRRCKNRSEELSNL